MSQNFLQGTLGREDLQSWALMWEQSPGEALGSIQEFGQAAVRSSLGGFDGLGTRAQPTRHPQPLPACTGYPGASQELGSEIKNANKSSKAPLKTPGGHLG